MGIDLYKDLPAGEKAPEEINVVVEIPYGSSNKYEYDEEKGYFKLDRILHSAMFFPYEYGFIPQTESKDGDPLDVMLLTTCPTFPGCVIKARPVGVIYMEDEEGIDNKIIAVPLHKVNPNFENIKDVSDLNEHTKDVIKVFLEDYKKLEKAKYKFVKVKNWDNRSQAIKIIKEAMEDYKSK